MTVPPSAVGPGDSLAAFPLTAIVGQRELVEALLVNAVSPEVGGVLVRGERGTAKSTAVRALAPLLPPVAAAVDQPFAFAPGELSPSGPVPADAAVESRAAPLVELPLGATLDRLVGALDLERALDGQHAFEPGLLARAHRGVLYVDEINLLPDHLVDALLDAAASGVCRVERDAVSATHAARFTLVGTMNVEEGELRPQLLDRFGLGVDVRTPTDPAERAEIVRRRLAFERDPDAFAAEWASPQREVAERIAAARARLAGVRLPERELLRITSACAQLGIDGVRGDVVCARAARALAALAGADEVGPEHVRRAAQLALAHRRRQDPLGGADDRDLDEALGTPPAESPPPSTPGDQPRDTPGDRAPDAPRDQAPDTPRDRPPSSRPLRDQPPVPARLPAAAVSLGGAGTGPAGRRARSNAAGEIDTRPAAGGDVAVVATLRDRLVHGAGRPAREHVRAGREGTLLCLVVDASGSMAARRRLARVKGALLDLLRDAYARRDRVALIAFRGDRAEVLAAPGAPLEQAAAAIRDLRARGRTPLAEGLRVAEALVRRETARRTIAVLLTDGRAADPEGEAVTAARALARAADSVCVVDIEEGPVRLGLARTLAAAAGATVEELAA